MLTFGFLIARFLGTDGGGSECGASRSISEFFPSTQRNRLQSCNSRAKTPTHRPAPNSSLSAERHSGRVHL